MIVIIKWSESISIKDIQMFLSFINFYRKFITEYLFITILLINFLYKIKKEKEKKLIKLILNDKV